MPPRKQFPAASLKLTLLVAVKCLPEGRTPNYKGSISGWYGLFDDNGWCWEVPLERKGDWGIHEAEALALEIALVELDKKLEASGRVADECNLTIYVCQETVALQLAGRESVGQKNLAVLFDKIRSRTRLYKKVNLGCKSGEELAKLLKSRKKPTQVQGVITQARQQPRQSASSIQYVNCPLCGDEIRQSRLVNHYSKKHPHYRSPGKNGQNQR